MWRWKYIGFITMLLGHPACAQFIDDFSDDEFGNNPAWQGDAPDFNVSTGRLRLQAPPVTGTATLATPCAAIYQGSWEFSVQMDFTPSSSNYAKVYLASDQPSLQNGYFVKIGGSTREVSLYLFSGGIEQKLIDGLDDRVNQPIVIISVRVTRDEAGNWSLYSDPGSTGVFISEGTATDLTHLTSAWFGVQCVYTATRSDKFWFDDFVVSGKEVPYTPPPASPGWKSVLILEILADPTPQVGLPAAEFVEIYNPGTLPFNLAGWKLTDGSSMGTFPSYVLLPGEFKVVTASSSVGFFNGALGLANFPSLNNSGDHLKLFGPGEILVDSVAYDIGWYNDEDKEQGGWSLELIDPQNPCGQENNWTASEDEHGGTPGQANSVLAEKPDLTPPIIELVYAVDSVTLSIVANEALHASSPGDVRISLTPKIEPKILSFADPSRRNLQVILSSALKRRTAYQALIEGLRDCNGNLMQPATWVIGLTEEADSLDLRISEVLFNPRSGGADFVEIFNTSEKFIDLSSLTLGNGQETTPIRPWVMVPGSQVSITESPDVVDSQYPLSLSGTKLQAGLPSWPDDAGEVVLVNRQGWIIDQFSYDHSWHSPLLQDEEGVSLERVDINSPTTEAANWQSASAVSGYATPGLPNSQRRDDLNLKEQVRVEPEIFSPGDDTFDFVRILYHFDQPGRVGTVRILNGQGALVRDVANNELLGTEGSFRWNGERDDGRKAPLGYYVVWMETFDPVGGVATFRKRVVVSRR